MGVVYANVKTYLGRGINNSMDSNRVSCVQRGKQLTPNNITFLKAINLKPKRK